MAKETPQTLIDMVRGVQRFIAEASREKRPAVQTHFAVADAVEAFRNRVHQDPTSQPIIGALADTCQQLVQLNADLMNYINDSAPETGDASVLAPDTSADNSGAAVQSGGDTDYPAGVLDPGD